MNSVYSEFNRFSDDYIDKLVENSPDLIYTELRDHLTPDVYTSNIGIYEGWVSKILERATDDLYENDFYDTSFDILYLLFKTSGFTSTKCKEFLHSYMDVQILERVSANDAEFKTLLIHAHMPGILIHHKYKLLSEQMLIYVLPQCMEAILNIKGMYTLGPTTVLNFVTYMDAIITNNLSNTSLNLSVVGCLSSLLDTPHTFSESPVFTKIRSKVEHLCTLVFKEEFQKLYNNAQMLGALQNPEYWKHAFLPQTDLVMLPTL